jgi:hypothetical protein
MYATLVALLALFFIIAIFLIITAPQVFNQYFGYQMLFTGPMLFLMAGLLKAGKEFYAVILGIFTFLMMLYIGGIFSDNPPENSTSTLLTAIAFFIFVAGSIKIMKRSGTESIPTLAETMRTKYTLMLAGFAFFWMLLYIWNPGGFMTTYFGPVMFFSLFIGFFLCTAIMLYNQTIGLGSNGFGSERTTDYVPEFMKKMLFGLVVVALTGLLIWGALKMFGLFDLESDSSSSSSLFSLFLNMALLFVVLGGIYKFMNLSQWMERNPIWNLLTNIVFFIPCMFSYGVNFAAGNTGKKGFAEFFKSPANKTEMGFFFGSLLLLAGYFFLPFVYKKYLKNIQYKKLGDVGALQSIFGKYGFGNGISIGGNIGNTGKLLVETPTPTNKQTDVTSFPSLSETETFDRQFAMSMWFYLDSFPPSTSSAYTKMVSLLSYGDNPAIRYSSEINTLFITTKNANDVDEQEQTEQVPEQTLDKMRQFKDRQKDKNKNLVNEIEGAKLLAFGTETDASGNRIIYKHPGVLLQKWNHVLINMSGGTMDVFYNGVLVKTAIGVVPYVKNDMLTIGCEGGVSGHVAGLTYFDHPLDITTIHEIYEEFREMRVPFIEV